MHGNGRGWDCKNLMSSVATQRHTATSMMLQTVANVDAARRLRSPGETWTLPEKRTEASTLRQKGEGCGLTYPLGASIPPGKSDIPTKGTMLMVLFATIREN